MGGVRPGSGKRKRLTDEERAAQGQPRKAASASASVAPGREDEFFATSPLTPRQAEIFANLKREMQLAKTDTAAFRRPTTFLAILEARAEDMRRYMGRAAVARDADGKEKRNPALAQLSHVESQIARLYDQLGLTVFGVAHAAKTGKTKDGAPAGGEAPPSEFGEFSAN